MLKLSIIIPTRRLEADLRRRIATELRLLPEAEVLVVEPLRSDLDRRRGQSPAPSPSQAPDGDAASRASTDSPLHWRHGNVCRLTAPRGRGPQCNAGARHARGELLLFLHDDTLLPPEAPSLIAEAFADPELELACFRLRFDQRHPVLGLYAWFSRFDSVLTSFGDQGILMRRGLFERLGGFPDWPLFEDVELLRRARRQTRIRKLPAAVITSAVRFRRHGVIRQQCLNGSLMLRFALGATPRELLRRYERAGRR